MCVPAVCPTVPYLRSYNDVTAQLRAHDTPSVRFVSVVVECQLAWLVYVIGCTLSGSGSVRNVLLSPEGSDEIDGDLARRALQLLGAVDLRLSSSVNGRLSCVWFSGAKCSCI